MLLIERLRVSELAAAGEARKRSSSAAAPAAAQRPGAERSTEPTNHLLTFR
jgi:hypothetical protein